MKVAVQAQCQATGPPDRQARFGLTRALQRLSYPKRGTLDTGPCQRLEI